MTQQMHHMTNHSLKKDNLLRLFLLLTECSPLTFTGNIFEILPFIFSVKPNNFPYKSIQPPLFLALNH